MIVIIAGSRSITDLALLDQCMVDVEAAWDVTAIVHGGARGVDALADRWAHAHAVPTRVFRPDWDQYGRAAGPIRNAQMAAYGDVCVLLWDGVSAGTRSMMNEAKKRSLPIALFIWQGKAWKQGYAPALATEASP